MLSAQAYRKNPHKLVGAISEYLTKQKIDLPKDNDLIKTGNGRQYNPDQSDWFYTRMAAIVRQAMCKNTVSLTGLAHRFGNRKNRGVRPTKFTRGSLYVIELAIKNLEKMGWFDFKQKDCVLTASATKELTKIMEKME